MQALSTTKHEIENESWNTVNMIKNEKINKKMIQWVINNVLGRQGGKS